jgi:mycofactocin precursor
VSEPQVTELEPETTPEQPIDEVLGDEVLGDDLLVEEISIDGMCGVY